MNTKSIKNLKEKIYHNLVATELSRLVFGLIVLILFAVVFIFDFSAYLSYHAPKNYILIVLTSAGFFIFWLKSKKTIIVTWLEIILLVRLIWVVITNPSLVYHPSNLGFWILLSLTLLTLLSRQISDKNPNILACFLRILWIFGLIQAVIGLYQFVHYKDYPTYLMKTAMIGTIGTANGYGLFLAVSIIAVLTDIKNMGSKFGKWIACLSVSLIIIALLLNRSRGAILGLISSFLILAIFMMYTQTNSLSIFRRVRLSRIGGVIVVFICFLFCVLFLYKLNPESSIGRFMEWRVSAPMIKDHPIKGVGHGRFAVEYLYYQSRYFENPVHNSLAYKAANIKQAHNEYLQAFCESGILGGLLFLSIWIFALWNIFYHLYRNRNYRRQYYGLALIFLTILVHALVDTPLHVLPVSVIAYIALGFIPAKESVIKKIKVHSGIFRCMISVVLLLFLIFILGKSIYQYPGYNHWNRGVKYARNHYWEMAIEQYQSALKRLGGEGELQFHLGSAMVLSGSNSRGIYFLKESLKNFNDKNIYLSLGYGFLHLKNYVEAEKYTRIALSMFPDHLAPHLLLGEIYYYQGRVEDSKASLKKCINRQTTVQSDDILQIAIDARNLWKRFFEN